MSEERKTRRWILIATILLLYPLSVGPVWRLAGRSHLVQQFIRQVYGPLFAVAKQSDILTVPLTVYLAFWTPPGYEFLP